MMSGPGVIGGTIVERIVGSIDLAPTFLAIAGVEPLGDMDGKSLLPLVVSQPSEDQTSAGGSSAADRVAKPPRSCTPDPCHGVGVCLQPLNPQ
jgi:arylsulfatase A-like enzyme